VSGRKAKPDSASSPIAQLSREKRSLAQLRRAAKSCRACPLWKPATQTVFGEGSEDADVMLIGEQPGDREDIEGRPFVGPAGHLLDKALAEIGLDRSAFYVTNTVKHFKFEMRGKRRLHKRANAAEIAACSQWLDAELRRLRARYLVCLGAMPAHVLLGSKFRLNTGRGRWQELSDGRWCLATVHPSFVLRAHVSGDFEATYKAFVADLRKIKRLPA
jgi:uracil-DNA glycosylase